MRESEPHFLNVDLELQSRRAVEPVVQALSVRAPLLSIYRRGSLYCAAFELAAQPKSADAAIRALAKLVLSLPAPARRIWNAATRRDFDIGIQSGQDPVALMVELSREAVQLVQRVEGRIIFTLYPPAQARQAGGAPKKVMMLRS